QLPGGVSLSGTSSDDGLPAGATPSCLWSVISGPGTVSFSNPAALQTTASFSAPGTYGLRLTATDSLLSGSDDVTVTVLPVNQPPTVALTQPAEGAASVAGSPITISANAADSDGTVVKVE